MHEEFRFGRLSDNAAHPRAFAANEVQISIKTNARSYPHRFSDGWKLSWVSRLMPELVFFARRSINPSNRYLHGSLSDLPGQPKGHGLALTVIAEKGAPLFTYRAIQ